MWPHDDSIRNISAFMSDRHTIRNGIYSLAVFIAVSLIALLLSNPDILLSLSGKMQTLPDPTFRTTDGDYLSLLPYDVLRQVCASTSSDPNLQVPLDGLSRSNKQLRDVSLPDLFHTVVIRGPWDSAYSRLQAMEECHPLFSLVKYPGLMTLLCNNRLLTRLQGL